MIYGRDLKRGSGATMNGARMKLWGTKRRASSTTSRAARKPREKQHENRGVWSRDWTSTFQPQYSTSLRSVA